MAKKNSIYSIIKEVSENIDKKQKEYYEAVELSNKVIRASSRVITMLHADRLKDAEKEVKILKKHVSEMKKFDSEFFYYTMQAYQEYAEAIIFYMIKNDMDIPTYSDIKIRPEPYLLGLMDEVGELRREVIEELRKRRISYAEKYFAILKEIYDETRGLNIQNALLNGFRRKQDVARIQEEEAASELLLFTKNNA
ncbi:MAG: hypothetical protein ACP5RP_02300 [Candidatus Micrarchaeia archaeon]